jgi:hypothetical protein
LESTTQENFEADMQFLSFPLIFLFIQLNFNSLTELEGDKGENGQLMSQPNQVRWERNHPYQEKEVVVRGFISSCPSGGWVLLGRPDVKSCCVEKSDKAGPCIYIDGDWRETTQSQAIAMTGLFKVTIIQESNPAELNSMKIRYQLEDTKLYNESNTVPSITLLVLFIGICAIGIYYLVKDRFHITSYLDWNEDDKR